MIRINLYIAEQQQKRLEELRDETGLSIAELIRRALDLYFKQEALK
jgi:hypothetical protein